jgi:drug/metabolite transporter (DMT)-like permease
MGSLAGAGLVHFIFGRISGFTSIRLIGANRAVPIYTCNMLIAVLLGILFLKESFTPSILAAIVLVFIGIILISIKSNSAKRVPGEESLLLGVLTGLGAALCWGISPVLVKIGLREVDSPLLAAFVSYAAASIIMGIWLIPPQNREKLSGIDRRSISPLIMAAITMAVAHLLRYISLSFGDLVVLQPLFSTQGLFVFPISFLINREIEAFNLKVILGAIAVVSGVFLIFWLGR